MTLRVGSEAFRAHPGEERVVDHLHKSDDADHVKGRREVREQHTGHQSGSGSRARLFLEESLCGGES